MLLSVADYRSKTSLSPEQWNPAPFVRHPGGEWHSTHFEEVVVGVTELLKRLDAGQVTETHLLRGKTNRRDILNYWLYYQHHPGSEYWKLMGQRYWSVEAWRSWRDDGGGSFPKRGRSGERGLVSEHVVPKKEMIRCILTDRANIRRWLERNLCCVVTVGEDRKLARQSHPDATDPWRRYAGTGIVLLHNPAWSDLEIEALLQHGLLDHTSGAP